MGNIYHKIDVCQEESPFTLTRTVTDAQASLCITCASGSEAVICLVLAPTVPDCAIELTIELQPHATLALLCMEASAAGKIHITQSSTLAEGARLHLTNISLGTHIEQEARSHLLGKNAVSDIDWIFYARNADTQKLSARNVFSAKNGGGEITMKGVAEHFASVRCDGMIEIGGGGGGTKTYLTEDVLMLDPTAKVDAVPELKIQTNDVRASHSAVIRKVTPEDIFYFASRGLDEPSARSMYVLGFLADLTDRIVNESKRAEVRSAIEDKFES